MNERIKSMVAAYGDPDLQWNDAEVEKFAELIVRECIMLQYRRGVEGFGILEEQMIKQHFGIES